MAGIIFGGKNLTTEFNVFTDESQTFVVPERDVEFFDVPGLNGSLSYDNNRYKNVNVPVNCFIRDNFIENHGKLMNYLLSREGYEDLELPTDSDHFRSAFFKGGTKVTTGPFNKSGKFTLEFICKPERWRTDGGTIITITSRSYTLNNPTSFSSKPYFTVNGKGTVRINGYPITILDSSPYQNIEFNSELMTCTCGENNAAKYVQLSNGFPVLKPGNNSITFNLTAGTGSTAGIVIMPRWFDL